MSIKLSICITAYNQIAIVKSNLNNIIKYKGNDIEIIVSDDCSTDDIKGMVDSFNDERLKYCRTVKNGGHDLNILNAIEKSSGEFVLILRSRDTLIPKCIPQILKILDMNADVAYCVFSAIDEEGKGKLFFSDKRYTKGSQAIMAHSKLFVHPSGNIYKRRFLDIDKLRNAINESFNHKFGFAVHQLIRMELACNGDFLTSSLFAWVYPNTLKQKDVAVNSVGTGKSVYDPKLNYERCKCDFSFVNCRIDTDNNNKYLLNKHIAISFYNRITYDFIRINKHLDYQRHYNFNEIEFDASKERKKYRNFIFNLFEEYNITQINLLKIIVWLYTFKLCFYYPARDYIGRNLLLKVFSKEQLLHFLHKMERL